MLLSAVFPDIWWVLINGGCYGNCNYSYNYFKPKHPGCLKCSPDPTIQPSCSLCSNMVFPVQSDCLPSPEYSLCVLSSIVSPCVFLRLEYFPPNPWLSESYPFFKPLLRSCFLLGSFLYHPARCSFNILRTHLTIITVLSICLQNILRQED